MNLVRALCAVLFLLFAVAAHAEQSALERLYGDLRSSKTQTEAEETVRKIWLEWYKSGDSVVDRMMREALNQIEQNQLKTALAILTQVVENAPNFPEGWNSRATVLFYSARTTVPSRILAARWHWSRATLARWLGLGKF